MQRNSDLHNVFEWMDSRKRTQKKTLLKQKKKEKENVESHKRLKGHVI